jgi:glycosyltransferase involved in cell wall biosynthesis
MGRPQNPLTVRPPVHRVFFLNRYFYPDESATAQLLTDLASRVAAEGFEVHIVCSRQLYGAPGAGLAASETVRGVYVHRIWTTRFGRRHLLGRILDYATFYMLCAVALAAKLRATDILVAETDPPLISLVGAAVARLKGAMLINWLQDVFPEVASHLGANPLPAVLNRVLRRLRDATLRAAQANVVLGSRMHEYIVACGVSASKCHIIENWADADLLQPKSSGDSGFKARLGLSGKFVIGYSGNLGRAHEYETAVGAAAELGEDERFAFLFVGGGNKMESLQVRVQELGLRNFHFLPYQPREELEDSLAAPDLHLVSLNPALEGLIVPSKFYGILAAGRPVVFIGDQDGELSRLIRANHCGLVVAPGDSTALVAAIKDLECDGQRRAAMGAAARTLLCSRFSATHALASWTNLLAKVAADQASPA